ncbi:MAG: histidine phosphatase family protein [bacterium]
MLEILLIRHGETDWNRERRIMGDGPIGLNLTGQQQLKSLGQRLAPLKVESLYASPLQRTMESASILNQHWSLPLELQPALREIEYGQWIGKTFHEIRSSPDYVEYYKYPEKAVGVTGESLQNVRERGVAFIEEIRKGRTHGKVVLVSHADWIKCMVLHYMKLPLNQLYQLRIDNASVTYLTFEGHRERVIAVNHCIEFDKMFIPRGPL